MAARGSLPLRILIKTLLNIAVVWLMATYLDQYFQLTGGPGAIIVIGVLITLMNMFLRPVLEIITLPLKLFATILAIVIVNGVFIEFAHLIALRMDPSIVSLEIFGGLWGWVVVATVFGVSNWLIKELLHPRGSD
jgi:uncharacterized membrane protein YvlD (DUF360 family)